MMKILKVTLPFGITPHTEPMQNKQVGTSGLISKKTMSHCSAPHRGMS